MTPRIAARSLTKIFQKHVSTRSKGISTEGAAAMRHLLQEVFRRAPDGSPADRGNRTLTALADISFDVGAGEVLGIIGRNGAGKSTLLKILARVLHPTAGRVAIHGRVVSMLELGVGFAPELTVRQNIQIHGRLAGIPAREVRAAEDAILAFSGLAAAADRPLASCGGGAAVQLGFAAVICLGAEVLLADEVLAVGDSEFRRRCEEHVRAAGTSGESVLFVSHDMAAIRRICTRVIWIDRGRIVRDGPTGEVVDAYVAELLAGRLLPPKSDEGLAASCRLLDVRLLDAHHAQVGALQLTEPGYLDCLFRIELPAVATTVEIELWHAKQLVFKNISEPLTVRTPTTFRAGLRIPSDLLNEQPYQARFRLHARTIRGGDVVDVIAAEEPLDFVAMNPHPERSVWNDWQWTRKGAIAPRLRWRIGAEGAR